MKKREEMIRDLHRRMDGYESDRKKKRAKLTKAAVSVTPFCAAAVVGVCLWKGGALNAQNDGHISSTVTTGSDVILSGNNKNNTVQNSTSVTSASASHRQTAISDTEVSYVTENVESMTAASAAADITAAEERDTPASDTPAKTNNDTQKATEATAVQTEEAAKQTTAANDVQNGNSPLLKDDEEPPAYLTVITSYPSGENSMAVPPIGNYGYSHSLYLAMEDYKDTANYLVIADVFSANGQLFDYDDLTAEAARLYNNGYTAAVETVTAQGSAYSFISLNVTYEQLQNFAVRSDYAYALRLYNN